MPSPKAFKLQSRYRHSATMESDNLWKVLKQEAERKNSLNCKHFTFKLLLLSILAAAFFTICLSYYQLGRSLRISFTEQHSLDARYKTKFEINWHQVSSLLQSSRITWAEGLKTGLVNFNSREEIKEWSKFSGQVDYSIFPFDQLHNEIQWVDLYPEWIDEEGKFEVPKCPMVPMPNVRNNLKLNLVVVKVPCNDHVSSSRDVVRLQVQLAAAHVALQTEATYVLLLDSCRPLPNLFSCDGLVGKRENAWLFEVDHLKLRKKLTLPVGSCELAVPMVERNYVPQMIRPTDAVREAYATVLHSDDFYVCGAIAVAQSIRLTGSTRDLVILVDGNIHHEHRKGLERAGWKVIEIERIRNPKAEKGSYNEWNYSKFRLWQLTDYDKVIFIDADLLVLRNIDFLFDLSEISATGNNGTLFNSGVMIIEPSECTFGLLMDQIDEIMSYNGGDQGYLNEVFTWWHRIPKRMNFLKHFWSNDREELDEKTKLFGSDPPELYVLHYLGLKPWLCYRDYDCNWNVENQRGFASDIAHAIWWKVHDSMPHDLQKFCLLRTKRKASLEWDRRAAQNMSFSDEHWKRNITDPRLEICNEEFCYWESMLWHWGDPNYDGTSNGTSSSPSRPSIGLPLESSPSFSSFSSLPSPLTLEPSSSTLLRLEPSPSLAVT